MAGMADVPLERWTPERRRELTRTALLEAAAQEFQANGYAATCMNDVAQRAGISTKTLYRLIPTKAELFAGVVSDRIARFILAIDDGVLDVLDPAAALERILIAYGTLTLNPETIAISRLVIGESDRFPEIATMFYKSAILRTSEAIESFLRRQCERGHMRLDDPEVAASMLRGMMIMEPQRAAMLRQRPVPEAEEIARRARFATNIFLDGCRA